MVKEDVGNMQNQPEGLVEERRKEVEGAGIKPHHSPKPSGRKASWLGKACPKKSASHEDEGRLRNRGTRAALDSLVALLVEHADVLDGALGRVGEIRGDALGVPSDGDGAGELVELLERLLEEEILNKK